MIQRKKGDKNIIRGPFFISVVLAHVFPPSHHQAIGGLTTPSLTLLLFHTFILPLHNPLFLVITVRALLMAVDLPAGGGLCQQEARMLTLSSGNPPLII